MHHHIVLIGVVWRRQIVAVENDLTKDPNLRVQHGSWGDDRSMAMGLLDHSLIMSGG